MNAVKNILHGNLEMSKMFPTFAVQTGENFCEFEPNIFHAADKAAPLRRILCSQEFDRSANLKGGVASFVVYIPNSISNADR